MDASDKSRREFLITAAAGTAALSLTGGTALAKKAGDPAPSVSIPRRVLGKTGVPVSILGFGGGSRWLLSSDDDAMAILERAVAAGVTYFDTAAMYGRDRRSERLYGQVLPRHRKSIFLATKTGDRTYDGAMKSIETSLERLKVDSLDLIQMHSAEPSDDLSAWDKPGGAYTAFRKLKEQKVARFIGFTGHDDAAVHRRVIETFDFDTVLMALNAARHKRFGEIALPAAVKKEMGIIAMKVARDIVGGGQGQAPIGQLLASTWDQPVSTLIIGIETMAQLENNVRLAQAYAPGGGTAAAAASLNPQACWMQPGYRDECA